MARTAAAPGFEYRSRLHFRGLPLVHVVRGVDPSSGRRPPAIGIIAVGQIAVGLVAVGQVAFGVISVGQAAIGLGWGIGQLAFGLLAAGQVAAGAVGAVGQIAVAPESFGMVTGGGPWVVLGWGLGGLLLTLLLGNRHLRALFAAPAARAIASLDEGIAHVAGRIVSADRLQAPLSSRPCVFWQTMHVGPTVRAHERRGGEVTIADETGTARVDLGSEMVFIRGDDYREIAGPDWALHLETALSQGDALHVAGPVVMTADPGAGGGFRGGGQSPLFCGRPDAPLIVTTRNPGGMRAEHRFGTVIGWTLVGAALIVLPLWLSAVQIYR
jgi:hypothetical protein